VKVKDIAWLAGLLEGEGSFHYKKSKPRDKTYWYPIVLCQMTDPDVLEKAASILGVKVFGPYKKNNPNAKDAWAVFINGKYAVALMMTILPFMGERRTNKILELIAYWKTLPGLFHPGEGEKHHSSLLSDVQVKDIRLRWKDGESQSSIAEDLHIHQSTVSRIVRNKMRRNSL
jgi:hypothetical protein